MSDLMKRETRTKLSLGVGGIVGGLAVLGLNSFIHSLFLIGQFSFGSVVLGGLLMYGSWKLFQKPKSALPGMIGLVASALIIGSGIPLVNLLATPLIVLGGVGLIAGGVWTIYKALSNRNKSS